jgi:dienelactone hydrolase
MTTHEPTLEMTPRDGLVDAPLQVRLHGLPPGEDVTVRARAGFGRAGTWSTTATYRAGTDGTLDLDRQAPVAGDFAMADASALIWSLRPDDPAANPRALTEGLEAYTLEVEAETSAGTLRGGAVRRALAPDVQVIEVREPDLHANLFLPPGEGPFPTVLVLGGSGGGFPDRGAALFASHGVAAVSLAYFGVEGLPPELRRIPLEYFAHALAWMREHPALDTTRLGVCGTSRGGELALLLGSRHPEIRSVVAYVPSSHLWGAISRLEDGLAEDELASWTVDGQALPYVGRVSNEAVPPDEEGVIRLAPAYLAFLEDEARAARAVIPVERINGPILLISGTHDTLWPSTRLGTLVEERARANGFDFGVEHLVYEEAGHAIGAGIAPTTVTQSWHPVRKAMIDLGGTPAGLARARADSWPKVLDFVCTNTGAGQPREAGSAP